MREEEAVVVMIALGCATGVLCALISYASAVIKRWIDVSLKRDMVARGYSVDEIIAVVQAERGTQVMVRHGDVPPAKPIRQPVPT